MAIIILVIWKYIQVVEDMNLILPGSKHDIRSYVTSTYYFKSSMTQLTSINKEKDSQGLL